ncbi:MAG: hypothetical protein ACYTG7_06030 [Planctomycetota bacterium]
MSEIPVYLKTDDHMPRPEDPEFFLVTRDGTYFCRNHPFFSSETPATRLPKVLKKHKPSCELRYPRLGADAMEYIVGFFDRVYDLHGSEAVVLLFWDLDKKRYKLWVPDQEASVWESYSGIRTPMDVNYKLPMPLPKRCLLLGDIHSHGNLDAYASFTDKYDEVYRDGIHIVVGHIRSEPPTFHCEVVVDGYRFDLLFDEIVDRYEERRLSVPEKWLKRVKVRVDKPSLRNWSSNYSSYHDGNNLHGRG